MPEISGIRHPPDIWPEIRYPVLRMAGYPVGRISGKTAIRSIPNIKDVFDGQYGNKHFLQTILHLEVALKSEIFKVRSL